MLKALAASVQLDPRIGKLSNGSYYAFASGYEQPEIVGALAQVQRALRLVDAPEVAAPDQLWDVVLRFQYPSWDEVDGIVYRDIRARSKSEAISRARQLATRDGHTIGGGKGRYWFAAQEAGLAG